MCLNRKKKVNKKLYSLGFFWVLVLNGAKPSHLITYDTRGFAYICGRLTLYFTIFFISV